MRHPVTNVKDLTNLNKTITTEVFDKICALITGKPPKRKTYTLSDGYKVEFRLRECRGETAYYVAHITGPAGYSSILDIEISNAIQGYIQFEGPRETDTQRAYGKVPVATIITPTGTHNTICSVGHVQCPDTHTPTQKPERSLAWLFLLAAILTPSATWIWFIIPILAIYLKHSRAAALAATAIGLTLFLIFGHSIPKAPQLLPTIPQLTPEATLAIYTTLLLTLYTPEIWHKFKKLTTNP